MQIRRTKAADIKPSDTSALVPDLIQAPDISWEWALNEIQSGLEEGRCSTKPNGGYVVNGMSPNTEWLQSISKFLQNMDSNKIVRIQMYVAITIHSHLFTQHTDPGQRSIIVQGQGRTAVVVGDQATVLEPGSIMYLNGDEPHRFTSLGPRFSITISLEETD